MICGYSGKGKWRKDKYAFESFGSENFFLSDNLPKPKEKSDVEEDRLRWMSELKKKLDTIANWSDVLEMGLSNHILLIGIWPCIPLNLKFLPCKLSMERDLQTSTSTTLSFNTAMWCQTMLSRHVCSSTPSMGYSLIGSWSCPKAPLRTKVIWNCSYCLIIRGRLKVAMPTSMPPNSEAKSLLRPSWSDSRLLHFGT